MDASTVTVNDLLDGHTRLDIECLDRIYLNGYVPNLQVGGQVVRFMTQHLGKRVPSPALLEQIGTRFRRDVDRFAEDHNVPVVRFAKGERKADVMRPHLVRQERTGASGVAAIGIAQEYQNVFAANKMDRGSAKTPWFTFTKADRRVTCYYFYLWDEDFGPGFIKICSYFPYPIKVWVNGHEWAKRQADRAGIAFTALSNGFGSCEDAAALQAICDRLGPAELQDFFDRWMDRLPVPLDDYDRTFGYWWELSMRQVETSRTIVFDAPRHARGFVDALITDNLTIGRPDTLEIIFGRQIRRGRKRRTQDMFNTKVVAAGDGVTLNTFYKHSRVKQYLKDGRALRVETVINSPTDLGIARRLEHLDELQRRSRDINTRLLDTERVGQGLILASPAFERVAQPTTDVAGRRAPALRFGDPRVMALLGALAMIGNTLGFTNRSLRAQVSMLLGAPYRMAQMSYDLARLTRKGLIRRIPSTNTYTLTPEGLRIAMFYTKVHDRLLGPLCAADRPPAPTELRHALKTIDAHVDAYIDRTRLAKAA